MELLITESHMHMQGQNTRRDTSIPSDSAGLVYTSPYYIYSFKLKSINMEFSKCILFKWKKVYEEEKIEDKNITHLFLIRKRINPVFLAI